MPTNHSRVRKVELQLTPTEAVIQWMLRNNRSGDGGLHRDAKTRREVFALFERVREATRTAMRGEQAEIVGAAVSTAEREAGSLFFLYAVANNDARDQLLVLSPMFDLVEDRFRRIRGQIRFSDTRSLLLPDLEVSLVLDANATRAVRVAVLRQVCEELRIWSEPAWVLVAKLYLLRETTEQIRKNSFDGHPFLGKVSADKLNSLLDAVEHLAADHAELLAELWRRLEGHGIRLEKGRFLARGTINLPKIKRAIKPRAASDVAELVRSTRSYFVQSEDLGRRSVSDEARA